MSQSTNHTNSEYYSQLATWDLVGKRVLLRADLNIPLITPPPMADHAASNSAYSSNSAHTGHPVPTINPADAYKLRALLPTIDLILRKGGTITLLTHLGRPTKPTPDLSSRLLVPWFEQQGYAIQFAETPAQARALSAPIILLENTRFFPAEYEQETSAPKHNHDRATFARELAQLGDYYVNDAFGALHRTDTSITDVAYQFRAEKRTFGLLVEKELHELNKLTHHPRKPFVLIIGGAKVADKIPLIKQLLPLIDTLILCPAIAFTFAYAQGKRVGISLVDHDSVDVCKKIIEMARTKNITVILPLDYQVAIPDNISHTQEYTQKIVQELVHGNYKNKLEIVDAESIPENGFGISIGPKTLAAYKPILEKAGTVLFNGAMGFAQQPETVQGMRALLQLIHAASGQRVIAGGDSVGMVMQLGMQDCFDYLSTGGGATLFYLSGQELPGLMPFKLQTSQHAK